MGPFWGPFLDSFLDPFFDPFLGLLELILDTFGGPFLGAFLGLLGLILGPGASWGSFWGPLGRFPRGLRGPIFEPPKGLKMLKNQLK